MSRPLPKGWERVKPICLHALAYLGIFVIAWLVSSRFAATTYFISDMGINLDTAPAWRGESVIALPPLGEITAATHWTPLSLRLTLLQVNEGIFQTMQEETGKDPEQALADHGQKIIEAIGNYLIKLFGGLVVISAALNWLLFFPRRLGRVLAGSLCSALCLSVILGATLVTYNPSAFAQARFDGLISQGASIFSAVNDALGGSGTMASKTYNLWGNLKGLALETELPASLTTEDMTGAKVLVVSDYHNNPVGVNFVVNLARELKPDFIVDCGDINDLGTSLETISVANLQKIKLPYVFIPGNHDGRATSDFVRTMPRGIVVTNGLVQVAGFTIAGFADPYYAKKELDVPHREGRQAMSTHEGQRISAWLEKNGPVDIIVTHRESIARLITTGGGIIFTGHTHRVNVFKNPAGIWVVNDGTTGAAGVRGLASDNPPAYSAAVVYFNTKRQAVAVDIISFSPPSVSQAVDEQGLPAGPGKVQMTRMNLQEAVDSAPATSDDAEE